MLNIGIVGIGCISGIYLSNLTGLCSKAVRVTAVCDLIRERAEQAAAQYGIPKIHDTMEELFEDPDVDVVLNLTRPYQHFAVSKGALLAGKHVYSEKPLGVDLNEGRELVRIAKEKNLWLGGAPDTFLGAGIQTCRRLIDSGALGEPIGGRFVMAGRGPESWHPDPEFFYKRGGGPLLDMGPYYLTCMINLLGGIRRIYGTAQTPEKERLITCKEHYGEIIKVEVPTYYDSMITLDSGVTCSLLTSFDTYHTFQTNIEIYGTEGTLYVPDPNWFDGCVRIVGKNETEYPLEFGYTANSRGIGLTDMCRAIETGRRGRTTYLQTFHVLEAMCGILESAKSGECYRMESHFEREAPMAPEPEKLFD